MRLRGRLSDLESLKSGKDRTKNHGPCLLGLLVHSNERNATDFHRELSRLPIHFREPILHFRDGYSSRSNRSLLFANLIALVAANSDLTSLQQRKSSLKEVIQPHLPVRLPCYDFTPLTGHSFGASVPYGFGQRLREQQIQVM